jgi:tetratricopeptide (TPR) repeat protein
MTTRKKTPAASPKTTGSTPVAAAPTFKAAPPPAAPRPVDQQLKTWDTAVRLFADKRYPEALELFRQTSAGPAVHVADKARSYAQICERKLPATQTELRTAEDHFYCGVERLSARDLARAREHLSKALRMQPDGDHILYTLALCCGYAGDANGAYENLKRAIDLEPKNRALARQDSDFKALAARFPALLALLGTDAALGA